MLCAAVSKVGKKIASLNPGRRRGLFVYLMGIDGTGKTSLAKRLVGSHKTGLIADYAYLGLKITLVQKVRSRLLGQNERERFDGQSGVADKLATKSSFLANLFNLVLTFFYIADYAARTYVTLRFIRCDNNLLVVDRGYYDKLTERQKWGNGLFYTLLPKPDLVIGLTGDIPTLYARKKEFEPEILAKMQIKMDQVWEFLANQNISFRRIDTTQNDPEKCVRLMNEKIWQAIKPDL
jgi:thymidylate kinase